MNGIPPLGRRQQPAAIGNLGQIFPLLLMKKSRNGDIIRIADQSEFTGEFRNLIDHP
jgi:hypothetical protein